MNRTMYDVVQRKPTKNQDATGSSRTIPSIGCVLSNQNIFDPKQTWDILGNEGAYQSLEDINKSGCTTWGVSKAYWM